LVYDLLTKVEIGKCAVKFITKNINLIKMSQLFTLFSSENPDIYLILSDFKVIGLSKSPHFILEQGNFVILLGYRNSCPLLVARFQLMY